LDGGVNLVFGGEKTRREAQCAASLKGANAPVRRRRTVQAEAKGDIAPIKLQSDFSKVTIVYGNGNDGGALRANGWPRRGDAWQSQESCKQVIAERCFLSVDVIETCGVDEVQCWEKPREAA
jgi:hypothetical protein